MGMHWLCWSSCLEKYVRFPNEWRSMKFKPIVRVQERQGRKHVAIPAGLDGAIVKGKPFYVSVEKAGKNGKKVRIIYDEV
jgi:hypothetical protein